ncbi:glutathione binding-like protein [Novosphingobium sp. M1R2S20]|uniref:Glutathione binding-like protein n=1 Tax=Novosphingobium rhizovicinum TaxID=3228928 RepID=A0ABV3RDV8_9SPHN
MITLYYAPNSTALTAHIALAESGLDYKLDLIDHYGDKRTSDGRSYFDLSPIGYVPAIELEDGAVLTESAVVLEYIADVASASLCPSHGDFKRYLVLQWVHFATTELHQKLMRLTIPGVAADYAAANMEQVTARFAHLNASLSGRDTLVGDTFTIADIYAFVATRWWMNKIDMGDYPDLQRFMDATARRPAVIRALQEEGIE